TSAGRPPRSSHDRPGLDAIATAAAGTSATRATVPDVCAATAGTSSPAELGHAATRLAAGLRRARWHSRASSDGDLAPGELAEPSSPAQEPPAELAGEPVGLAAPEDAPPRCRADRDVRRRGRHALPRGPGARRAAASLADPRQASLAVSVVRRAGAARGAP